MLIRWFFQNLLKNHRIQVFGKIFAVKLRSAVPCEMGENEDDGEFIVGTSYDYPEENEYIVACRSEPIIYPAKRQREDSIRRSNRRFLVIKRGNDERTESNPTTRRLDTKDESMNACSLAPFQSLRNTWYFNSNKLTLMLLVLRRIITKAVSGN